MRKFSPEWWQNKRVSHTWCHDFCTPFYLEDISLLNEETYFSLAVVFFDTPNGNTIPVGFTAMQEGKFVFQYHPSYLADAMLPAISVTLPKRKERYEFADELPPFFDNLLAEGWFGKAQGAALKHNIEAIEHDVETIAERYHRMNMFGRD